MLNGIPRTFSDGDVIFRQGDAAADMYVIRSGNVRIARTLDDGAEVVLALLGEGDFFGEIALFHPGPRTATATAVGALHVEVVDRPTLMDAVDRDPSTKELIAEMSARIRQLQAEEH